MELTEVMRTTFACRDWTDEPVDDATLHQILDSARFAPTGGNRQGCHVIVVKDPAQRAALVPLIQEPMNIYWHQRAAGEAPWNTIEPSSIDDAEAGADPVDHMGCANYMNAPVVLVIAVDLSVVASFDSKLDRVGVISGASVYPLVWNILLGARNAGLGGVLTTGIATNEAQVQEILGLPSHFAAAALLPIGHPVKQLTKLTRRGVDDFVTVDRFDGKAFTS